MSFSLNAGPTEVVEATSSSAVISLVSVSAGDLIVIGVYHSSSATISSITISGESNATLLSTQTGLGATAATIGYLLSASAGGTKTITVNLSGSFLNGAWAASYTSTGTVSFDAEAGTNAGSSTPTVDLTTVLANALVIGQVTESSNHVETQGSGYTLVALSSSSLGAGGEYDLDGGAAGLRAVDFSLDSGANWALKAASFGAPPAQDGVMTFAQLTAEGTDGSGSGAPSMASITALGYGAADGAATFSQLTALGYDFEAVAAVAFEQMTAVGYAAAVGGAVFRGIEAYGQDQTQQNGVAAFASLTASSVASFSPFGAAAFEQLTNFGVTVPSHPGIGAPAFQQLTATGEHAINFGATGAATMKAMSAFGTSGVTGAAVFPKMTALGQAPNHATGVMEFKPLMSLQQAAAVELKRLVAAGISVSSIPEVYAPKVVNMRTGAVTEYSNHSYNSFARIGGTYYAAGTTGLIKLTGTTDPSSADIDWDVKTGQMDDKDPGLKRLPEVVLGLRANNKITVRVHPDDTTSYDYQLPVVNTATIHQHRVKPGKGMRSRYYAVELIGDQNSTLELDSMQVNMTKTTRRLG